MFFFEHEYLNSQNVSPKSKDTLTSYCKYCLYQRAKTWKDKRIQHTPVYEIVSKKSFEELELIMTEGEKELWSKVPDLNVKKRVCRLCYTNKTADEIEVIRSRNWLGYWLQKQKERHKKELMMKNNKNSVDDKPNEDALVTQMLNDGWIGPISRTCSDPSCASTTGFIKIRPPLSDDEPPMVVYRCAVCRKTNVDYKQ